MYKRYKHLGSEERGVILAEHRRGSSLREIGLVLGRAPSTIGRELARGRLGDAPYDPQVARSAHDARSPSSTVTGRFLGFGFVRCE